MASQEVLKCVWPSMDPNRLLFIQIQTLPPSLHHTGKEAIGFCVKKPPIENHRGPTPDEEYLELRDYDNEVFGLSCIISIVLNFHLSFFVQEKVC